MGSSPLARGLPRHCVGTPGPPRIIPARAGFTAPPTCTSRPTADHPRSRGVYQRKGGSRRVTAGSSPLARGLPKAAWPDGVWAGIIPARAGFTRRRSRRSRGSPDHPRSRGVYNTFKYFTVELEGSSPLARGLLDDGRAGGVPGGIIPARAGFTAPADQPGRPGEDHPRSRGVYFFPLRSEIIFSGSSPLARGLLDDGRAGGVPGGIIPARAGFTILSHGTLHSVTDHPRSRGVYENMEQDIQETLGSSPLARGLPVTPFSIIPRTGIIPARAGFTTEPCRP